MFRKSVFALNDEEDAGVDGPGMDGSAGGKRSSKGSSGKGGKKEKWKGLSSAREKDEAETEQWRKFATLKRQLEKHRTTVTLLLRQDEKAKQVGSRYFMRQIKCHI